MARIWEDRVCETATTTGTGDFTLAGAVAGYVTFASVCTTNDTAFYCIEAINASGIATGEYEIGLGTYSAANTLTRTTVLKSSNSNALVSFSAGSKHVMIVSPAKIFRQIVAQAKVMPQGRLTLVSGTPVLTSDQTAKTAVYYTPYIGDAVPLYDGVDWFNYSFSELTLNLDTSNHPLDNLYDIFVWNNAGTISIGTGPAWNYAATVTTTIATPCVVSWTAHGLNEGDPIVFTTTGALPTGITAGTTYYVSKSPGTNSFNVSTSRANAAAGTLVATSGSQSGTHTATVNVRQRGTGAGTTELQLKNGIWTNKNSITLKNGAGAGTSGIAANTALYVGTIYCTASGQTWMAFNPAAASGGSNGFLGVYNAYNRTRVVAQNRDSTTTTWTYGTATWRSYNNSASNRISFVDGLGQMFLSGACECPFQTSSTGVAGYIGVNLNSTSATPPSAGGHASTQVIRVAAQFQAAASLGLNYLQMCEYATGATVTLYASPNSQNANNLTAILEM